MGFPRSVSPSPPFKRSPIPTVDGDENEENYYQMRGSTTPRVKKSMKKNYMSSTISAASKAITPKKKILAERNESFEPIWPEHTKNPVLGEPLSLQEPRSPQTAVMSRSNFGDGEERRHSLADGSKPYDPLTNFLSPRPRFLRYNPDRRREIFRDGDDGNEVFEDGLTSGSVSSSSSSSSLITGEIRRLMQDDDEGGLKETNVEKTKGEEGLKEANGEEIREEIEIKEVDEEIEENVETKEEEANEEEEEADDIESCGGRVGTMLLLMVLGLCAMFIVSVNCAEPSCCLSFRESMKAGSFKMPNRSEEASLGGGNRFSIGRSFDEEIGEGYKVGNGVLERYFEEKEREWSEELKGLEDAAAKSGETGFEDIEEESDLVDLEWSDELKSSEDSKSGESDDHGDIECSDALKSSEDSVQLVEPEIGDVEEVFNQSFESAEEAELDETDSYDSSLSEQLLEIKGNPLEEDDSIGETSDETEPERLGEKIGNLIESLKHMEAEFAVKVLIGVVSFSAIVAYCVSLRKKKKQQKKACFSTLPSKTSNGEDRADHHQVYSFTDNLSSFVPSSEKVSDEYSQSNAPSVEFLGEFVVGQDRSVSSSDDLYACKTRADSPLYRSFSAKEDDEDEEANSAITPASRRSSRMSDRAVLMTPVRRSSRIRNLSIKSP